MQPQRPYSRTPQQPVQPYHSTQPQQSAVAPSGTAYARQDIQKMLEEDKRKKKILLIGLPSLAVVVGAIAALLFLFIFGGGLSPEEYKEQALEVHGQVTDSFMVMDGTWTAADVDLDLSYSEGYSALNEESGTALSEVKAAQAQLNEIKPPGELETLHNDLMTFYTDAENYMGRADPVFKFVSEWSAIMEDWDEKPWAVDRLTEDSTPAEVIALMDEDLATMDGCISQFEALETPLECETMKSEAINYFIEYKGMMERMKRALINYDMVAAEVAYNDMEAFANGYEGRFLKMWEGINTFQEEFWALVDRGEALEKELGGKPAEEDAGELVGRR